MNKTQERTVKWLKKSLEEKHFLSSEYEFKRFEVDELECGIVSVVSEIGLMGDEGTMAAIFGRDYRHIMVGKRGGLTLVNPAKIVGGKRVYAKTKVHGRRVVWSLSK